MNVRMICPLCQRVGVMRDEPQGTLRRARGGGDFRAPCGMLVADDERPLPEVVRAASSEALEPRGKSRAYQYHQRLLPHGKSVTRLTHIMQQRGNSQIIRRGTLRQHSA